MSRKNTCIMIFADVLMCLLFHVAATSMEMEPKGKSRFASSGKTDRTRFLLANVRLTCENFRERASATNRKTPGEQYQKFVGFRFSYLVGVSHSGCRCNDALLVAEPFPGKHNRVLILARGASTFPPR